MASDGSKARPSRPGGDAGLRKALMGRDPAIAAADFVLGLPSIAAARGLARGGLTTVGGRGRGRARRRMRALGTAATEPEAVRPRILPPTSRNDGPTLAGRPAGDELAATPLHEARHRRESDSCPALGLIRLTAGRRWAWTRPPRGGRTGPLAATGAGGGRGSIPIQRLRPDWQAGSSQGNGAERGRDRAERRPARPAPGLPGP